MIEVPDRVYDAEEIPHGDVNRPAPGDEFGSMDLDAYEDAGDDDRRPCPMCGEMIQKTASKCRFCGEVFDAGLKRKVKKKKKSRRSYSEEDENLSGGEWVLAILCSGIGCIMGIIG